LISIILNSIGKTMIGGVSDPRNATLIKMFNLINVGERSGSGIPKIFAAWEGEGWKRPELTESFEPDRTTLTLELVSEKPSIKTADKKPSIKTDDKRRTKKTQRHRDMIMAMINERGEVTAAEVCQALGIQATQARTILRDMVAEGVLEADGGNRNRRYRAK
jgi:predicted HTH transcriptional regulator